MTILYRILSVLLNIAALFLAFVLVASSPILFSSPLNMLSGFMLVCIVLYAFFAARFHGLVLVRRQVVKRSLRDWIRVNGIVSLVYGTVIILGMAIFLQQPQALVEQMKQMGVEVDSALVSRLLWVLLVFGLVLVAHIILTFRLVKKNLSYFQ